MRAILSALLVLGLTTGASALEPAKPSDIVRVSATSFCPYGPFGPSNPGEAFDSLEKPDGTVGPFAIPAGTVLVVTAIEIHGNSASAGDLIQLQARVGGTPVVNGFLAIQNVTAGPSGGYSMFQTFPTGAVVRAGAVVCAVAFNFTSPGTGPNASGILHGFLIADK
jgi:hypothetical protein